MNKLSFLSISTFSSRVMPIVKLVLPEPLMAEAAGTHFHACTVWFIIDALFKIVRLSCIPMI